MSLVRLALKCVKVCKTFNICVCVFFLHFFLILIFSFPLLTTDCLYVGILCLLPFRFGIVSHHSVSTNKVHISKHSISFVWSLPFLAFALPTSTRPEQQKCFFSKKENHDRVAINAPSSIKFRFVYMVSSWRSQRLLLSTNASNSIVRVCFFL